VGEREGIEVRSYWSVFEFERRIYRIDRLTLNPSGIPVRGIVYAAVLEFVLLALSRVPLLGLALVLAPWPVRYVILPCGLATLFAMMRVAGRPFHHAARAMVVFALSARRLHGLRACPPLGRQWAPGELITIPNGTESRLRRFRYRGPGLVSVERAHARTIHRRFALERLLRRPDIVIAEHPRPGRLARRRMLELRAGALLETRGTPPR
jgi:hypothetical protein